MEFPASDENHYHNLLSKSMALRRAFLSSVRMQRERSLREAAQSFSGLPVPAMFSCTGGRKNL